MSIFDNKLPFGILRDEEPETYRALVKWHEAGKPVEVFFGSSWRSNKVQLCGYLTYRAVPEPPSAEEIERLRRKVAAGEKMAALVRVYFEVRDFSPFANEALRAWEEADERQSSA